MEILIAAAIVATGLLAMVAMFPGGYSTVTKSGIQSTGLALAQQRIEFLRNAGYGNITTGTTTESLTVAPYSYTRTTVVQDNTPTTNAKTITVTVTLPSAGAPTSQPIVLTTIVAL